MDRSAAQIGMQDSPVFHDPAGLDGTEGFDGGNFVSARDLAIAGRDLLSVPELARIVTEQSYHFVDPKGEAHWIPSMAGSRRVTRTQPVLA
jgi:D-alanyl-D-alanine carboxypeptidase